MTHLPYEVISNLNYDAEQWCEENIGTRWSVVSMNVGNWACFWQGREEPTHYKWYFKNESDAMLFILKWT